jgi:transcription antitermination factor NusG
VQVRKRLEKSVALGLRQKGYEEFVPMHELGRSCRGANREEALFPGYVFCCIGGGKYGLVVTTPGVIRILGAGSCPTPIDPVEINSLRLSCETGHRVVPCEFLNVGDWVTVEDGPLAGAVGILMERRNEQRLIISVSQCMRSVAVEVSGCRLRPLDKKPVSGVSAPLGGVFAPRQIV